MIEVHKVRTRGFALARSSITSAWHAQYATTGPIEALISVSKLITTVRRLAVVAKDDLLATSDGRIGFNLVRSIGLDEFDERFHLYEDFRVGSRSREWPDARFGRPRSRAMRMIRRA